MNQKVLVRQEQDILGRYDLSELIQSTEQGRIFRGTRRSNGQEVVLKFYHERVDYWREIDKAEEGAQREVAFLLKAQQNGRKDVPTLQDYGFTTRMGLPEPVAVMERVPGRTLREIISEDGFNGTVEDALRIAKQVGATLTYAHTQVGSQPFYHRDLKPENIMVDDEGHTVVLDWARGKIGPGNTRINTAVSSLCYTAPEVVRGETVTAAADVYSLGMVLKNYLFGKEFDVFSGEVSRAQLEATNVPRHIIDALEKAALENPLQRQQSIEELIEELQSLSSLVAVPSHQSRMERWGSSGKNFGSVFGASSVIIAMFESRNPSVYWLIGGLGAIIGGIIVGGIIGKRLGKYFDHRDEQALTGIHPTLRERLLSRRYPELQNMISNWEHLSPEEIIAEAAKESPFSMDSADGGKVRYDGHSPAMNDELVKLFEYYAKRTEHPERYSIRRAGSYFVEFHFEGSLPDSEHTQFKYLLRRERTPGIVTFLNLISDSGHSIGLQREQGVKNWLVRRVWGEAVSPHEFYQAQTPNTPSQIEELLKREVPVLWDIAHILPNDRLSYLTVKKVRKYHRR